MEATLKRSDRHNPLGKSDYLSVQHIGRYRFACTLLQSGQEVLDIACGTGYGTAILLKHGCKVVGADLDGEILKEARSRWNYNGFMEANVLDLPFPNASFDAVVSFETIEHVIDGERFLAEMHRVLRPNGIFICSTPNIRYTAHPKFHLKEYEPEEFFKLVEKYFTNVQYYGQYFKMMDRLRDLFHWYVRSMFVNLLVKMAEVTHLKLWLKKLLAYNRRTSEKYVEVSELCIYDAEGNPGQSTVADYYKVCPIKGTRLLRIMVAVGRKK